MTSCPSHFALDDLDLHPADAPPAVAAHVASCPRCRQHVATREALKDEFRASLEPAVWSAVRARAARSTLARWALQLVLPVAAAAMAVLLFARPGPASRAPHVAAKGGPPTAVEVHRRRGDRVARLAPGEDVRPGDELRFRVRATAGMRFVSVGSVDGTGRYAPFYPPRLGADSVPLPGGDAALPGGITVDDAPGPERLLVVLSPTPVLADAVRAVAERDAPRLAPVTDVGGVAVQAVWIVLPKGPGDRP